MFGSMSSWGLTILGALAFSGVIGLAVFRADRSGPEPLTVTVGLLDQRQLTEGDIAPNFALVSVREGPRGG